MIDIEPPVGPSSAEWASSEPALEAPIRAMDERFGGAYISFWLVFLGFALYSLLAGNRPLLSKIVGVALLAGFVAVYIVGNAHAAHMGVRKAWIYLAVLTVITVASVPIFGADALAFAPYICAWATIMLPLKWGAAVAVLWTLVSLVVAATVTWEVLTFTAIIVAVSATTIAVAVFTSAGQRVEEMRLRTQLAADRERVARDVHDVLGHSLTAVVVKSELAQRLIVTDPDAARRELVEIESLSRSALAEIRTTVGGLRATRLSDELSTARRVLASAGIELDAPDDIDSVEPRSNVTVAWVVREATTNIVRHSGAQRVTIRWGPNWIEVIDDGRGLGEDVHALVQKGNGLSGLRDRVTSVGGVLKLGQGPNGVGTRVRVENA